MRFSRDADPRVITPRRARAGAFREEAGEGNRCGIRAVLPRADYRVHWSRGNAFCEGVNRNFLVEARLRWVCPIVSRSARVQPSRDAPSKEKKKKKRASEAVAYNARSPPRGGGGFPLVLPARDRAGISRSLGARCPSLIRHSYIRAVPPLLRRLALETGHGEDPPSAPAALSSHARLSFSLFCFPRLGSLGGCVYLTRDPTLGAFRPLTLLSAPREGEESSLGPVAAGAERAIEIGMCRRREIYRDSITLFGRNASR